MPWTGDRRRTRDGRRARRRSTGAGRPAPVDRDASLLSLIDRLAVLLERGDLAELEVEPGGTAIILRKPSALAAPVAVAAPRRSPAAGAGTAATATPPAPAGAGPARAAPRARGQGAAHRASTTASPSPGATPYVAVGDHVSVGQIIGLIEAMKLFNEIKSDLAGRVVRICAESGALVKAKQPLIEVEPA